MADLKDAMEPALNADTLEDLWTYRDRLKGTHEEPAGPYVPLTEVPRSALEAALAEFKKMMKGKEPKGAKQLSKFLKNKVGTE